MEVGEREIIYLSLHCHHANDFCIKMGSDVSHFNVSVGSDGHSHKTVSTNHNLSEEKGKPKRYRTEILSLTSLTPYRWAKPVHEWRGKKLTVLNCERNMPTCTLFAMKEMQHNMQPRQSVV